ncbi:MAG: sugar phosphate isomerase/epimerase [Caldilineaceae bacterium]|nr:sugar phosphate isomerase/epimerase [Caldilineaceae bacterium]MCB9119982.1 sugar phosphate isomerase/epimerase [Caldilineaceae bacterium]HRW46606.1 sugar phosphate isomerase/epimerase family protein [Caldilinea sp.]
MEIGIFAKTFVRPTVGETLDAVAEHGLRTVQFNLSCVGLPTLPDAVDPVVVKSIRRAFDERGMTMAAISGTFNMINPDRRARADGLRRLGVLASICHDLGTNVITLCTGTRDPDDMWRAHPDNQAPTARGDLAATLDRALLYAEQYDVTLAIEPEVNNVVSTADEARRLLETFNTSRLRLVLDAANLIRPIKLPYMSAILNDAFSLLGSYIVLAHAKDVSRDGAPGKTAPGQGDLDFDSYLSKLAASGYKGPLIIHGLDESQVPASIAFLREKLAAVGAQAG